MTKGRLCLVVLTALTGALAFSAPALAGGTPEWFECVKQKGGSYEKGCAAEGGKGGYIARPGLGTGTFHAFAAKATIGGPRNAITCAMSIEGTKVAPNLVTGVTITLKVCSRADDSKDHCEAQETKGPKETTLESEPLQGELGYIGHSPLHVGLKLANVANPGGPIFTRIYCIGPTAHFIFSGGSVVGEIHGAVNASSAKSTLAYVPGDYLGEGEPEVNPPLEGEPAGTLVEEIQTAKEVFGEPLPTSISGSLKIVGAQMIRA
jgi:hypothetical protein